MSIIKFIKNWTLPIAMLAGALSYFVYVNIHALDSTHAIVNQCISIVQPALLFAMLFVSFCKVSPRELRPHAWMLKLLGIQVIPFVLLGIWIILCPEMPGRVIIESAMICLICPTATAASVVTMKLKGDSSIVVSYTCIINIVTALLVSVIVPFLHETNNPDISFTTSFLIITGKIFPLLILPLVFAWGVRFLFPRFHRFIKSKTNLAFYLWAVSLALAIAVTTKAIAKSDESIYNLIGIAAASLICCLLQFIVGRLIGRKYGCVIACAQSLGQKNTVFAIWMGYTFMNPVTAMAGGFYSVWHNAVNSYQLWKERKKERKETE